MNSKLAKVEITHILGATAAPPLPVKAPQFEGSLGLLLQLVTAKKINLADIPLLPVAQAYYSYLHETLDKDMDSVSAALVAIAYLVERKAIKLIAPENEEFEDVLPVLDPTGYLFAPAVETLETKFEERQDVFFRQPGSSSEPFALPIDYSEISANALAQAFSRILEKAVPDKDHLVSRPKMSLKDKMSDVISALSQAGSCLSFVELLPAEYSKLDVVWTFLALLELIRQNQADISISGEVINVKLLIEVSLELPFGNG